MSFISKSGGDMNHDIQAQTCIAGSVDDPAFPLQSSNVPSSICSDENRENGNITLAAESNEVSKKTLLIGGGDNTSFESGDSSEISDCRKIKRKLNSQELNNLLNENEVDGVLRMNLSTLSINEGHCKAIRNLHKDTMSNSEDDSRSSNQVFVPTAHKEYQPMMIQPSQIPIYNEDIKAATSSEWKWHGTPRPTKPVKVTSPSESSSRVCIPVLKEQIPSKIEDDAFKMPTFKPKWSSTSKIPVSSSRMASQYGKKSATNQITNLQKS